MVTGGASGIGLGIVKHLASQDIGVILADSSVENVQKSINTCSPTLRSNIFGAVVDVRKSSDLEKAVLNGINHFESKHVDILVACAGIQRVHRIEEFPENEWDDVVNVNQKGLFGSGC